MKAELVKFDLKYDWAISRNTSTFKQNLIIQQEVNGKTLWSEVAPNIRYNETPESVLLEWESFSSQFKSANFQELNQMRQYLQSGQLSHSFAFGLNYMLDQMEANFKNQSLPEFYNIPRIGDFPISYTIPIMEEGKIERFIAQNNLTRFDHIKLKVNKTTAEGTFKELTRLLKMPIMVDGNECFQSSEEVIDFLNSIDKSNLIFLEQPLPSSFKGEIEKLKQMTEIKLIADESIELNPDWEFLIKNFDGVNVKLMKCGSIQNGIQQLYTAKDNNMTTMIGCMIESTIGIKAALGLCSLVDYADLDGFLVIDNEPYQQVVEKAGCIYLP